jgi:predicted transcriptional regulator
MTARTMTLNLSEAEMAAVDALAAEHDLSKTAIIRQALRLYQYTNQRLKEGERMIWSGDAQRAAEFIGVGFPLPQDPRHG